MSTPFIKNCPVIETTADGDRVGRCWFYMEDGKTCPRHGDVTSALTMRIYDYELPIRVIEKETYTYIHPEDRKRGLVKGFNAVKACIKKLKTVRK